MLNKKKIHCGEYIDVIQAIDSCNNSFEHFGVKNIEWSLVTIREIEVEGLSERWLKIVGGKTAWN
jgi:hypothetical protein